jgi:hypothetical protein
MTTYNYLLFIKQTGNFWEKRPIDQAEYIQFMQDDKFYYFVIDVDPSTGNKTITGLPYEDTYSYKLNIDTMLITDTTQSIINANIISIQNSLVDYVNTIVSKILTGPISITLNEISLQAFDLTRFLLAITTAQSLGINTVSVISNNQVVSVQGIDISVVNNVRQILANIQTDLSAVAGRYISTIKQTHDVSALHIDMVNIADFSSPSVSNVVNGVMSLIITEPSVQFINLSTGATITDTDTINALLAL